MKKFLRFSGAIAVSSLLLASVAVAAEDYVMLRVGDEQVMASEVEEAWKNIFPDGKGPDFATVDDKLKQQVLQEVASKRLVYAQALKEKIEERADVKERLAILRRQALIQAYVEEKMRGFASEDTLKAAYDNEVARLRSQEEIHGHHILVATEDEAKDIIKQLEGGKEFAALAKEKSLDKASAAQGGDLGYFLKEQMVPEFGAAAFGLKAGELSKPVQSKFGWHIIKVEDRRAATVPSYEAMKGKLREDLLNEKVAKMLEELASSTKITVYDERGNARPLSPSWKQ